MYKYENDLAFMRPFYKDVQAQHCDFESDDYNDNNDIQQDIAEMDVPSDNSEKPVKKEKKKSTKGRKKKKRSSSYEEDEPSAPVFTESVPPSELDPGDPVDAFLLSIGATLKTFSPYHLNLAKSKIFAVVQEHDLQQIVQRQRYDGQTGDVKISTSSDNIYMQ